MTLNNKQLKNNDIPDNNVNTIESKNNDISNIKGKSVEDIYNECKIGNVLPVLFNNISKKYNVDIYGTDFTVMSQLDNIKHMIKNKGTILGMVTIKNNNANVYYNNSSDIGVDTQRFIIAHELGHCSMHFDALKNKGKFEFSNANKTDDYHELICDKFARDLLIPKDIIDYFYNKVERPSLMDLANAFLVPENEMSLRLEELGYARYI